MKHLYLVEENDEAAISIARKLTKAPANAAIIKVTKEELAAYTEGRVIMLPRPTPEHPSEAAIKEAGRKT